MAQPKFLLGNGHRLTAPVTIAKGMEPNPPPYDFDYARKRLAPQFAVAATEVARLPALACPDDYAVGLITIHPQYTAKSYFPAAFLREARMDAIGSRPSRVKPERWTRKAAPEDSPTTEIFVSARRADLAGFAKNLPSWDAKRPGAKELFEIEEFRALRPDDRLRRVPKRDEEPLLEVVLHTTGLPRPGRILEAFEAYAESLDLEPDLDRRFEVGGLCFLPVRSPKNLVRQLSQFAFLRVARPMPLLRPLKPILRTTAKVKAFPVKLPDQPPVDKQLRAAVFDGGIPSQKGLLRYAQPHEPSGIGASVKEYVDHGMGVTSAVLFGPLAKNETVPRPYGVVDHYRVLDDQSEKDPYQLYDTLMRIRDVLQSRKYSFVNLSIGPALNIEDNDVHAWTAVLDDLLADGETLTTIAVGNEGEKDWESGNARVQVPADSVNSLAVGAASSHGRTWKRAAYSCIGPGRSPGLVKPDLVAFGGTPIEPFFALDPSAARAIPSCGTSFASPSVLRTGMGIRAHFGTLLSPLAIKALLVHCSEPAKGITTQEIGWGRIPKDLDALVVCGEGIARIVYQGELTPAQYLRTPIPLPSGKLEGMVTITSTFSFACETDPKDPSNYTRGGLDVTFRPHADKFDDDTIHPRSASYFRRSDYDTERELRHDAHKWETVLHRSKRFRPTSLKDPFFDVHYQVRQSGDTVSGREKVRYALIITVFAPRVKNLYDRIVQRYRTQLEPLVPVIEVPIQIG